ncbi:glycosyl transferase family protein [cyanobacterium endosymbiont of Rhopalodia gibberula]|uniref:glycosyltransferase family 2 protein n=1 Tax=cyanobacterium endosymbiont of Rhopalodia gibberula TaxID=1763363 RepID=UPI000DC70622|nr:glycosyltransferase family 2 protein [cyanobacterium endosymbiont of Rhopalodia gibberula]BBA79904.1 glycosyl transferase family protein [cyanobacterium endosymbiont of Rhopalodia gibberula]
MKLSIVIPVYNEIHTIESSLTKVVQSLPGISKEIVLVDDGSTDGTREWLLQTFGQANSQRMKIELDSNQRLIVIECETHHPQSEVAPSGSLSVGVQVIFHKRNQGKGAALQTGFKASIGEVILIQDADLEYDPQDWKRMWRLIEEGWADVVYGSRFYGEPHRVLYFHHLLGNKVISNFINLLCNTTLTDIEVCTKMFRREVLDDIELTCNDFGFEVEFTVKVAKSRRRWRLYEAGISYYGRSYAEGKKINWTDGVKALWYAIRFWATN